MPVYKGTLPRVDDRGDRRVPRRQRAAHPAGVRGRHGDDDVGQGRDQAGPRGDEGGRRDVRPEGVPPGGRRLLHRHARATCCRSRSTARRTVFYYNKDAFKKAGLDPNQRADDLARGVRRAAAKIKASGASTCGYTTGWPSWVHIENFSAWHNLPIGDQGRTASDGLDTELQFNAPAARHAHRNICRTGRRRATSPTPAARNEAEAKFYSGECAMLTSSSAAQANINARTPSSSSRSAAAVLRRRRRRAAELDHRRRVAVGDGRQEAGRVQGRRQVLHLPVVAASVQAEWHQHDRLPADHPGGLRA